MKEDPRKASLSKDKKKNMGSPKKWETEKWRREKRRGRGTGREDEWRVR